MMPNMDPRQMAQMMRRMGVEMRDIPDVQEVVIRTKTKTYTFTKAAVSVMKAQGTQTWQIQGTPKESASTTAPGGVAQTGSGSSTAPTAPTAPAVAPSSATATAIPATHVAYTPTPEDIATVAEAAGVSGEVAKSALEKTKGDLAQAILDLYEA